MATKKEELAKAGVEQAGIVINDSFINGMAEQLATKEKFGLTFPEDYNYRNELLGAYLILKETKDKNGNYVLQSCSPASIANTLMDMATMGLSMQKRQCYPVAYGGRLQCQVSVYGHTCVARRFGMKNIDAMVIYKGDTFKYHVDKAKIVIDEHVQDFMNMKKEDIIGAYAVVTMQDGSTHVELMNMDMIKAAWRMGYGYKETGGTHDKFADQMALKTVKNRALKYIVRTYGTQYVMDGLDAAEQAETSNMVVEDVKHDIQTEANSVDFDAMEEEPLDYKEIVDEGPTKAEEEAVPNPADLPEWMRG